MRITLAEPMAKPWLDSPVYQKMVANRDAVTRSYYASNYTAYRKLLSIAAQKARILKPDIRTILLCGAGGSHEEVELACDVFPEARSIHVVEWHEPNIDLLRERLAPLKAPKEELEVVIHHDDIRCPGTVPDNFSDFVFVNKLFDLYRNNTKDMVSILSALAKCLVAGGVLHSFDYPFLDEDKIFDDWAELIGFRVVSSRLLVKDPAPFTVQQP